MSTLILSLVFGSIGAGYFIYGKKQKRGVPLAVGIALCFFPYVVSNPYAGTAIGVVLTALPWFLRGL
jgi:hypothetical protein